MNNWQNCTLEQFIYLSKGIQNHFFDLSKLASGDVYEGMQTDILTDFLNWGATGEMFDRFHDQIIVSMNRFELFRANPFTRNGIPQTPYQAGTAHEFAAQLNHRMWQWIFPDEPVFDRSAGPESAIELIDAYVSENEAIYFDRLSSIEACIVPEEFQRVGYEMKLERTRLLTDVQFVEERDIVPSVRPNADRDGKLLEMRENKMSYKDIAREYNLKNPHSTMDDTAIRQAVSRERRWRKANL